MKPQRISSKDYEELLKTMRRWPDPYRTMVAKLIGHIAWQFEQIQKLEARYKKLEQSEIFKDMSKPAPAMEPIKPVSESHASPILVQEKWPLPKRLKYILDGGGVNSTAWIQTCKWNALTTEKALLLIEEYLDT